MNDLAEMVSQMAAKIMRTQRVAIEEFCERSLCTGTDGVLQVNESDGSISLAVTPLVPYGNIYIVRRDYLDQYLARAGGPR